MQTETSSPGFFQMLIGIVVLLGLPVLTSIPFLIYGIRHRWELRHYAWPAGLIVWLWGLFYGRFLFKIKGDALWHGMIPITLYIISWLVFQVRIEAYRKARDAQKAQEHADTSPSTGGKTAGA